MGFFRDLVRRFLPGSAPSLANEPRLADPPQPIPEPVGLEPATEPIADPVLRPEPNLPGPSRSLGDEPTDFLPVSGYDWTDKVQDAVLTSRSELRDRIPSIEEDRTRSIDQAMINHGFLTAETLDEIHRVGAEIDQIPLELVSTRDRAQLKIDRKAASIERRRIQAEAVAHRKATEIRYLGRGVSNFLDDHASNRQALEESGLPVLSTPGDLAEALGLSVSKLRWLAFHAEAATRVHYVTFTVPKKSGGTRTLKAPHRLLAATQRWILDRIVSVLPVEPEAHGFVNGRSILTNARAHVGRSVVVNMDLEDFFPSVGFRRVRGVFRRAGYSPSVATILGLLCTECPRREVVYEGITYQVATGPRGLPQGASTSPALSNQVARRLDRRLAGLAFQIGTIYTRYADDLTFSGDQALQARVGYLMTRVRHLALAEGFVVNDSKTRVLRRNTAQVVTGLVVNDRPGVARDEIRRLRAILHRAKTEGIDAQNRQAHPNFRAWLRGKIAYVAMSRPDVGGRLLAEWEALESST